jgi:methionine sulfoxide reductase catalytic subunit
MNQIKSSEITPEHVYYSRRDFLKTMGMFTIGALSAASCGRSDLGESSEPLIDNDIFEVEGTKDEVGDPLTSFQEITNYTNYYEFSTGKSGNARLSQNLTIYPWIVSVGGLVSNPKTYDIGDLVKMFSNQELIYRLRCVEGWSMVIPWLGFPLAELLKEVEPRASARYVRFETLYDPEQMPGQKNRSFQWPYVEGLRLDEALNNLTILATGLYGRDLTPQNGAPIRLVVPWKYGFKSIKGIVKIDLVEQMPVSLWMNAAPNEYGFYANVNPDVSHPRWSQSTERRIGDTDRRPTLLFNGYADKVAHLYDGMDLNQEY